MWLTFILATHTLLVFAEDAPRDLKHFKGISNSMDLKRQMHEKSWRQFLYFFVYSFL